MPKLKKFKTQNEKKISTKNLFVAFGIILLIMGGVIISKTYAIYKLEKKYDIIQSKIGSYSMGDVRVAVIVDGKEASEFPNYETNYKVEKVECTNGVNASFDVKNWQINIADMSATSTKCTVYFNSNEQNSETPIAYSKEELLALNEEIKNTTALQLADKLYPIGSIYMSTTDDTVEKVQSKFGGTWVKYSEGTTLVGVNDIYKVNSTGGSSSVTLTNENLPSHSHVIPALSGSTDNQGQHSHTTAVNINDGVTSGTNKEIFFKENSFLGNDITYGRYGFGPITNPAGAHTHTVTTNASNTTICTNCSATSFSVQNPYTAVYMYKRTA